jgi:ankyrin repeat protein
MGVGVVLACGGAGAQATGSSDATDGVGPAPVPVEPVRVEHEREHVFADLARGGPWRQVPRGTMAPAAQRLMDLLVAGHWTQAAAWLKESDPPVDARDAQGRTPLTLAVQSGQLSLVRELIRRGAPVDAQGLQGFTPIGLAAYLGQDLMVRELLRRGADPDLPGLTGQPPMHLACLAGQTRTVAALLAVRPGPRWAGQFNRSGRHPLAEAAYHGQLAVVQQLLQAGMPMTAPDQHRLDALYAAALGRQAEVVRHLEAQGAEATHGVTLILLAQMASMP